MRDIRSDLRERLDECKKRRAECERQLAELDGLETHYQALLQMEEDRWEGVAPNLFLTHGKVHSKSNGNGGNRKPLGQMIVEVLREKQPRSKDELCAEAARRSYPFGEKSPKRVVHFALIGMKQNGVVESDENDLWRLKDAP